ncbi:hypothetical protein PW52_07290 [Tamlana sedimentorum]|uniref:histidine kinase n=2 Tax=Neotamlana sedimentorum TaxID=1435349 RepID=A0A0D7WA80_9FLAO|nr:hypothetical protein PW52_07290 [Tamlana sedimentorum]
MLDKNMVYIAVSQKWLKDYNKEDEVIVGRSHYDVFPEIGDDWKKKHKECLNGAIDKCSEAPFKRADGTTQWIFWDVRPWYETNGNIGGLIMFTGDITKEREQRIEKERIEKILQSTNKVARIGIWELDLETEEYDLNDITKEILELPKDFKAKKSESLPFYKEGESRKKIVQLISNLVKNGQSFDVELEMVTFKGKQIYVRKIGQAECVNGKVNRLYGVFQDITNAKLKNRERVRTNKILEKTNEIARIGTWELDLEKEQLHWSKIVREIHEVPEDYVPNVTTALSFYKEGRSRDTISSVLNKSLENGAPFDEELELVTLKGNVVWVRSIGQVEFINGKVVRLFGVIQDITKEKKAKNELLKRNELLTFAEEIALMGNYSWNLVTDDVKWSKNLYKIFGLEDSKLNLNYQTYFNFVHPDDKNKVSHFVQNSILNKKFQDDFIHRIVTTNGKVKNVHLLGKVITNQNNEVVEIIGTCQDITQQREEELKFKGLLESAADAMIISDENSKIQIVNQKAVDLFGYKKEEFLGKSVDVLLPARYLKYHKSNREGFIKKPKSINLNERKDLYAIKKNGKEFPIQISLSPLKTEEGILISAVIRDITKEIEAEKELLRKNEILNFAEHFAKMGSWEINLLTNEIVWSDGMYDIFELEDFNQKLTFEYYYTFVHPEDKEEVIQLHENLFNKNKFIETEEHRIITAKGKIKSIMSNAEAIKNNNGDIVMIKGITKDITFEKEAEVEIKNKNEMLSFAEDLAKIGNWIYTSENDNFIWSQGILNILEINNPPDKISFFNDYVSNYVHPEDKEFVINTFNKILVNNKFDTNIKHRVITNTGKVKNILINGEVELNKNGTPILLKGTFQDRTNQIQEQQHILKTNSRLETLAKRLISQNKQLSDFAQITSHNLRAPVSNLNALLDLYFDSESKVEKGLIFDKFNIVINRLTITLNTLVEALRIKNAEVNQEIIFFDEIHFKVKQLLSSQITESSAILISDFSEVNKIKYNKQYFESILLNLVENAIKYRSKKRTPVIKISSKLNNDKSVKFMIEDNGLGIDMKRYGDKIFGLNQVFHKHPLAKGVGLFMTKAQVESMGGSIVVSSEIDKGTTFVINFNNI